MPRVVLVVDDHEVCRRLYCRKFESLGARVMSAIDGNAAWVIYQSNRGKFDLVWTDLNMPNLNGRDLLAMIIGSPFFDPTQTNLRLVTGTIDACCESTPETPFVVLTKPVDPADYKAAMTP
jgi:CheY-like chemotaxis protein